MVSPHTTRSRMVLEIASELSGFRDWPYPQARVSLREPGTDSWKVCLFGSGAPSAIEEVARGEAHVAIINPATPLTMAFRGTGPFKEPIPLRAIAVIPSADQFVLAVSKRTGLTSLGDIRERHFPLRVSLRGGRRDHSVHFILDQLLAQFGYGLEKIREWGGEVRYDKGLPNADSRIGAVRRGEVDAIFDEAINVWGNLALESDMRFLPLEESVLKQLEALGLRRAVVSKEDYPQLSQDIPTLDFSGWAVYTHANVPDELIVPICAAMEARKDRIPWEEEGPLPLERMCRDTPEGPLDIPLHPAAEQFWRERGYLR